MLAGPADYTPVHFGERRRDTTWAHQIASAAIFTSDVLIYGAHPRSLLENPAAELIKMIPSTWDETIALPVSSIGELAAFARRKGNLWFLAIMNGPTARAVKIPLSFLPNGNYKALMVGDSPEQPASVRVENKVLRSSEVFELDMPSGGGFIGSFTPSPHSST
jgi:alpha-glucosidase